MTSAVTFLLREFVPDDRQRRLSLRGRGAGVTEGGCKARKERTEAGGVGLTRLIWFVCRRAWSASNSQITR